jgi:hypothetical protein
MDREFKLDPDEYTFLIDWKTILYPGNKDIIRVDNVT